MMSETIRQILGLKASASQSFNVPDPNGGGDISIVLNFRPRVQAWFMDLTFDEFVLNGYRIHRSPNMLYKFHNVIPFGIMVTVSDNFEPFLINDFTSGRVALYLLTSTQVASIQTLIESTESIA